MDESQNRVKVDIFGRLYTLRGNASQERLTKLAALVDERMNALFRQNPRLDQQTLAVLVALNIAEEYDELRAEYDAVLDALELDAKENTYG